MDSLQELFSATPTDELFHYTSAQALYAIYSSRTVWATHINYLNDSAEFRYSCQIASDEFLKRQISSNGLAREFYGRVAEVLARPKLRNKRQELFVFCLSEKNDLLSQWRSYCPREGGYSIGIRSSFLVKHLDGVPHRFVKCVYNRQKQLQLIKELFDAKLAPIVQSLDGYKDIGRAVGALLDAASDDFFYLAAALKHPAFEEESEWRLVLGPIDPNSHEVFYRAINGMLVPYMKVRLGGEGEISSKTPPSILGTLTVGPNPHQDLAAESLMDFIANLGIKVFSTGFSQIPYRPL